MLTNSTSFDVSALTRPFVPSIDARRQTNTIDGITYKIASCQEEREEAFRLVHDTYVTGGLMDPNAHRMRVTPWHLLPTTDLFVAIHEDEVVYTITLISDDSQGVPMDAIYPNEVDALRAAGIYFAELSCLASRRGYFSPRKMFDIFVRLNGLMIQYARYNDLQQVLIAIHPRHARFYQRALGFEQMGGPKAYEAVRGNPAVACVHDFARLDLQPYLLYDRVYATRFDWRDLLRQPMLPEERDALRRLVDVDSRPMLADAG
jgi:hypothetical protein